MNSIWLPLAKSVGITFLVAFVISYFLIAFSIPFINSFIFLIIAQFLFFYFYGNYQKNKQDKYLYQLELKAIEENNKQSTTVICPCDRGVQTVIPINVNGDNQYRCPGCDKNISVLISARTALTTTPVTENPLQSPIILETLEKVLKQNNDTIPR